KIAFYIRYRHFKYTIIPFRLINALAIVYFIYKSSVLIVLIKKNLYLLYFRLN
ncbi:hypothetical protein K458DRAFT_287881, partial [Lentithecium fluviatile CBS 122367]